jgi:hypothetical protein
VGLPYRTILLGLGSGILLLLLNGCAFDVVSLQQVPTQFETDGSPQTLTLSADTAVPLEEGHARSLKKGTTWQKIGRVTQGDVFRTRDQVVTVVASNEFEAQLVISNGQIVGFYLPVQHSFVAARMAVPLSSN